MEEGTGIPCRRQRHFISFCLFPELDCWGRDLVPGLPTKVCNPKKMKQDSACSTWQGEGNPRYQRLEQAALPPSLPAIRVDHR